jgi:hypothetical protein
MAEVAKMEHKDFTASLSWQIDFIKRFRYARDFLMGNKRSLELTESSPQNRSLLRLRKQMAYSSEVTLTHHRKINVSYQNLE